MTGSKGTIGILTGGGDVPGLNPAIRAITIRALREGYRVVGTAPYDHRPTSRPCHFVRMVKDLGDTAN